MNEQLTYYENYKELPPRINHNHKRRKRLAVSKWIGVKSLPAVRRLWFRILDALLQGQDIYWSRGGFVFSMRRMARSYTIMNDPATWYVYISVRQPDGTRDRRWRLHLGHAYLAYVAKYLKEHQDMIFQYKHTQYK